MKTFPTEKPQFYDSGASSRFGPLATCGSKLNFSIGIEESFGAWAGLDQGGCASMAKGQQTQGGVGSKQARFRKTFFLFVGEKREVQ